MVSGWLTVLFWNLNLGMPRALEVGFVGEPRTADHPRHNFIGLENDPAGLTAVLGFNVEINQRLPSEKRLEKVVLNKTGVADHHTLPEAFP